MTTAAAVSTTPLTFLLACTFASCSSPTGEGDFRTHLFTLYDAEGEPVTPQLFVAPVLWIGDDGSEFRIEGGLVSCWADDPGEYYAWSLTRPDGTCEYGASGRSERLLPWRLSERPRPWSAR